MKHSDDCGKLPGDQTIISCTGAHGSGGSRCAHTLCLISLAYTHTHTHAHTNANFAFPATVRHSFLTSYVFGCRVMAYFFCCKIKDEQISPRDSFLLLTHMHTHTHTYTPAPTPTPIHMRTRTYTRTNTHEVMYKDAHCPEHPLEVLGEVSSRCRCLQLRSPQILFFFLPLMKFMCLAHSVTMRWLHCVEALNC